MVAYYLLTARDDRGRELDPVAQFHRTNGALVPHVHTGADTSPNGLAQSCGAMVNHLYDPRRVQQNPENFASEQKIPATALARIKRPRQHAEDEAD